MKKARIAILGAALTVGVATAVASLVAQSPEPRPDPRPPLMVLDGRGSQLGVVVEDLDSAELKDVAGGVTGGVRIQDVERESPAEKAGLREGDVVVEYDGEGVRSARQFTRLVQETPDGRTIAMAVVRGGQRQTISIVPEGRSAAWRFDIDGRRLGRDIERSLRDLPRFHEFRFDGPAFDFDMVVPRSFSPRGRLGVQLDELTPQLADYFGAKDGGVLVTSVTEGSAAEKAGLKAGDVITSVNGDRVRDYEALAAELRRIESGEVTIGILRDRKESTVKATLEASSARPRRFMRRPAGGFGSAGTSISHDLI
jgi:S1-C subfamily serine protease